jgi:hypothetical protein
MNFEQSKYETSSHVNLVSYRQDHGEHVKQETQN